MVKRRKLLPFLLSVCLLLLNLAACGEAAEHPGEEVGGDWRSWGIIDEYKTIIRGGEEIGVCVCLHIADAAFYYDRAQQELYDSVTYPCELPEGWEDEALSFADLNGDGQSDVSLTFTYADGAAVSMVWLYGTDGFVYSEERSDISAVRAE